MKRDEAISFYCDFLVENHSNSSEVCNFINHIYNDFEKQKDAKARSIVAMLFWEGRKAKRLFGSLSYTAVAIQCDFEEAYKMLKG